MENQKQVVRWVEKKCPDTQDNGGAFLLGVGTTSIVALILNAAKDKAHQEELQQMYWQGIRQGRGQMTEEVSAKDAQIRAKDTEIRHKDTQIHHQAEALQQRDLALSEKDAEIAHLNAVVESQAKTLAKVPIACTLPLPAPDSEDDGNGKHMN
jgi:hypothetical protein